MGNKMKKELNDKYEKALKELNNNFNHQGIKFEDAGNGWKRYKEKIKRLNRC